MTSLSSIQVFENVLDNLMEQRTLLLIESINQLENRINLMEQYHQKNYLQQKEVCREFGIGHRTLKQWVSNGLNEIWLENRVFYDRKDLDGYLELHKI